MAGVTGSRSPGPADPTRELQEWIRHLAERLRELRQRVAADDTTAWAEYRDTAPILATVLVQLAADAERRGARLTTRDMAKKYSITSKTLLRRVARGEIRPDVQHGKFIRWRGDELPSRGAGRPPGRR